MQSTIYNLRQRIANWIYPEGEKRVTDERLSYDEFRERLRQQSVFTLPYIVDEYGEVSYGLILVKAPNPSTACIFVGLPISIEHVLSNTTLGVCYPEGDSTPVAMYASQLPNLDIVQQSQESVLTAIAKSNHLGNVVFVKASQIPILL